MFEGYWPIRRKAALATVSSIFLMLALPALVCAMPPVLQPTATLTSPDWRHWRVESVAIDGDFAVAVFPSVQYVPEEDECSRARC